MAYGNSIVPTQLNPAMSPELERDVAFFCKWGYLVIDNAISPEQVESLRAAMDEQYADHDERLMHGLLERDARFHPLLTNPPVLDRIRGILGTCVQLHSSTGRVTKPGEPEQGWHRDGPWPMDPAGTPYGNLPGQINCGYYLDALTMENGPVRVVPGSHRAPFRPPSGPVPFPDELAVLAKPGQCVLFDGWTFHRGGANASDAARRVCLMCYQNAWMKSREDFSTPRVSALREAGDELTKLLLGGLQSW